MAEYKIVKEEDDDITFEKSAFTYEFTKSGVVDNILYLRKIIKQMKGQIGINSAEMENIEHFHPFVKDMTEEDLQVAFMYERSLATRNEAMKKLEEAELAEKEELATVAKIEEQLGIKIEVPNNELNIEVK